MVLLGGFYAAPGNLDNSDDPLFTINGVKPAVWSYIGHVQILFNTIFSR